MKQKTKHLSKSAMSIVLTLVLVVSTLAVGIVATSAAYLNGKPNTEANAADVAGDNAVGAKADETVGANIDAGGSGDNYCIYLKDGTEYYNAYNINIEIDVTSARLDGKKLTFTVKNASDDSKWYGNNESISAPGGDTNLAPNNKNGGYLYNADQYTKVTIKLLWVDGNLKMYWVSGVSTAHNVTYNTPENGSLPSNTTANTGDWVQFAATPNPGYQVSTVTYTPSGGSATNCTQVSGNTYKFQMPDSDVEVNATFSVASYAVTASYDHCTLTGTGTYAYNSSVTFTVTPQANYALQTLTVKQGTTNVPYTDNLDNTYTFTMPAGPVEITAICANTSGTTTVYFKSATAYVYHPLISVNGGTEQAMSIAKDGNNKDIELTNGTKSSAVKPKSDTGSLRYVWYKAELSDVDLTAPVSIVIRGQDTYMEATGTFSLTENGSIYLACDNLMEGNVLVDVTSLTPAERDFYDTPLNMIDD